MAEPFDAPQLLGVDLDQVPGVRVVELQNDPKEKEVRDIFKQRAAAAKARVDALPKSWEEGRAALQEKVADLKAANATEIEIAAALARGAV
jgi:cation/acetate symporter